jgi:hypothetical protein
MKLFIRLEHMNKKYIYVTSYVKAANLFMYPRKTLQYIYVVDVLIANKN